MKSVLKSLKTFFFVIAFIYIGWFMFQHATELRHVLIVQNWSYLVISLLFLVPSFFAMFWARFVLTEAFGMHIPWQKQLHIFSHNMLTRYIPGGIWNQLDAVVMLKSEAKKSFVRSGKLVVLEMFWRVVFGYVFFGSIIFDLLTPDMDVATRTGLFLSSLLLLFLVTKLAAIKKPGIYLYSFRAILMQGCANFVFYLTNGLSFFFLLAAFKPTIMSLFSAWYVSAAFALSWIGGFLFLPAPSGLGVREVLMGAFMQHIGLVFAFGFSLVLLNRVIVMIRDVILYVLAYVILKFS